MPHDVAERLHETNIFLTQAVELGILNRTEVDDHCRQLVGAGCLEGLRHAAAASPGREHQLQRRAAGGRMMRRPREECDGPDRGPTTEDVEEWDRQVDEAYERARERGEFDK